MALPETFLQHLREEGYHPRSNKHSNSLGESIVADLVEHCPAIASAAGRGDLVYQINFNLVYGTSTWNVDIVLGKPPPGGAPPGSKLVAARISKTDPSTVLMAIELKSIMTEHRKAVKNRKRDLEAHHEHVHNYDPQAIAGGVFVVNIASRFDSPTRDAGDITTHSKPVDQAAHCLNELRNVSMKSGTSGAGLDAKAGIVVNMDNISLASTKYHEGSPAPQVGDPIHYDAFIQRLCVEFERRFA